MRSYEAVCGLIWPRPYQAEKNIFTKLDADLRRKFREEWYATGRSWGFVSLRRFKTTTVSNKNKDIGIYCNWIQLCNKFGGYNYEHSREEALEYANAMQKHGHPYYVRHAVTKRENWLFVDKLLECESTEDLQGMGAWEEC